MPCSVQNYKTIRQLKHMLWTNEISRDYGLRWVSDGYPILQSTPRLRNRSQYSIPQNAVAARGWIAVDHCLVEVYDAVDWKIELDFSCSPALQRITIIIYQHAQLVGEVMTVCHRSYTLGKKYSLCKCYWIGAIYLSLTKCTAPLTLIIHYKFAGSQYPWSTCKP